MLHVAQESARHVLLKLPFQIFIGKDQRADRTAKIAATSCNRLIAGSV